MLVSEFISRVNYALRGIDDEAPSENNEEWAYWVSILNRKKDELYEDVTKRWSSVFDVRSLGTVSASSNPVYNIESANADFLAASDTAYVTTTEGQNVHFDFVKPAERNNKQEVYISGQNPQKLSFTQEIAADSNLVGGTLYLPGYYLPADVTDNSDVVPLPDANWGVMAVASEIAFNDIVYEDKSSDINAKANNLYRLMVRKNKRGTFGSPRKTPIRINRVRSLE